MVGFTDPNYVGREKKGHKEFLKERAAKEIAEDSDSSESNNNYGHRTGLWLKDHDTGSVYRFN